MIHYISGDMVRQVLWTKRVLDAFIMEGNLNRRQEFILRARALGCSIQYLADELNLSTHQVNKDIAELRLIYDATQIHSKVLPERKETSKELFKIADR